MSDESHESDWILKAMVAVAASDGHLDTREIGIIQEVYEESAGRPLGADAVVRAADQNASNNVLDAFTAAEPSLDEATKEAVIRSAYLVLLADKRIAGEERKKLHDIAKTLKISEIHFGAILEDLTSSLETKA